MEILGSRNGLRAGGALATLVAALVLMAPPARAVTLRIADATLETDGVAQPVGLAVDDATGIEGFELTIAYDPAVVRVVGPLLRSALTDRCLMAANSEPAGRLRIAVACLSPLRGAGTLLTIPLAALAPGSSPFIITAWRIDEQASASPRQGVTAGVVTVRDPSAVARRAAETETLDHQLE